MFMEPLHYLLYYMFLYHFWCANTFTFTFVLLACSRWGTHCLHDTDVKTVIGYVACVGKPYKLVANLALEATFFLQSIAWLPVPDVLFYKRLLGLEKWTYED